MSDFLKLTLINKEADRAQLYPLSLIHYLIEFSQGGSQGGVFNEGNFGGGGGMGPSNMGGQTDQPSSSTQVTIPNDVSSDLFFSLLFLPY